VRYRGIWWHFLDLESLGLKGLEIHGPCLDHFGRRGTPKYKVGEKTKKSRKLEKTFDPSTTPTRLRVTANCFPRRRLF
jgi:hypothetical protein